MKRYKNAIWLAALVASASVAQAQSQCPEGAPSCKVVTITPEELKTLTDLIFPAAVWANRAQATDLVKAWENKINAAPAGEPFKKTEQPAQKK